MRLSLHTMCGVLVLAGVVACGKKAPPTPPPPTVFVTPVIQRDVALPIELIGVLDGYIDAEIRPRVEGYLESVDYREGGRVRAGDVLFTIDPGPYEAALAQARGEQQKARADLAKAEADVSRYAPLVKLKAISREMYDDAQASRKAAKASVAASDGALEQAQLNLDYTVVRSPIDGIAGTANFRVGNLVSKTDTLPLTTVSRLDPMRASFTITEQQYLSVAQQLSVWDPRGPDGDTTLPGSNNLTLILANGEAYPERGTLEVAGREVDPTTGTITLQAFFPNPDDILRPGQFARVRAVPAPQRGAMLVPGRAINELLNLSQVYVVGPDNRVVVRNVTLGAPVGQLRMVRGLQPNDRVIVEGLQKVKNGMVVVPKPAPKELDSAALFETAMKEGLTTARAGAVPPAPSPTPRAPGRAPQQAPAPQGGAVAPPQKGGP